MHLLAARGRIKAQKQSPRIPVISGSQNPKHGPCNPRSPSVCHTSDPSVPECRYGFRRKGMGRGAHAVCGPKQGERPGKDEKSRIELGPLSCRSIRASLSVATHWRRAIFKKNIWAGKCASALRTGWGLLNATAEESYMQLQDRHCPKNGPGNMNL